MRKNKLGTISKKTILFVAVVVGVIGLAVWLLLGSKIEESSSQAFIDKSIVNIEKKLPQMQKLEVTLLGYSIGNGKATIYRDKDNNLQKIVAQYLGELGKKEATYYLDDNYVIFVSEKTFDYDKPYGTVVKTQTDQGYFEKDALILWLAQDNAIEIDYAQKQNEIDAELERLLLGVRSRLAWSQTDNVLLSEFVLGKTFYYSCASGEGGTFESDGTFVVSFGLDFTTQNSSRKSSQTGKWKIEEEKLIISGTTLSDGVYKDLVFELNEEYEKQYGDYTVAYEDKGCGLIIGPSSEIIDEFRRSFWYDLEVQ